MGQAEKLIVNLVSVSVRFGGEAFIGILLTPILLSQLGFELYGFLMAIGASGVLLSIAMLALQASVARELGYSLGTGDIKRLRAAFSSAFFLQILVSIVFCALIIAFTPAIVGALTVPKGYEDVAHLCLILTILQFGFGIASSPFGGLLRAYQDLQTVSLLQFLLKLSALIAALLMLFWGGNKLVFYISVLFIFSIPLNIAYIFVAVRRFPEAKPDVRLVSISSLKTIVRYGSFSMISFLGANLRWNGITVLLNIYYGNIAASASSIATRVAALMRAIVNLLKAVILPAMVVNTGAGKSEITLRLVQLATAVVMTVAVPLSVTLLFETEVLLQAWLSQDIPPMTAIFVQLAVVSLLLSFVSFGHNMALSARGDIGTLVLVNQGLIITCIALFTWGAVIFEKPPWWLLIGELIGVVLAFGLWQPYWVVKRLGVNPRLWIRDSIFPSVLVFLICYLITVAINRYMDVSLLRAVVVAATTAVVSAVVMWKLGLRCDERKKIRAIVGRRLPFLESPIGDP